MFNIIKKIGGKNRDSFGDTLWSYNSLADKKALVLSWFFKLPKKSKVLEAGCGTGNYVVSLTKMRHNVTGIEIDSKRVNIAKKYMQDYNIDPKKIVLGDLTKLPFKKESFDAIFCHGVIEHIIDSNKAIEEMTRVLKKGGFAMISVPNRYTFFTISKILLQIVDNLFGTKLWNVGYEKSFSQYRFKKMLENHLKIIDFTKKEVESGSTFPLYGRILRILDKPLWLMGIGGGWLYSWSKKIR